jgi:hypothetical protein
MPVGIGMKFADGKQEQYDAVAGEINVQEDPPEGLVVHCAGPLDEGWSVIEVWESREHFDRFAEERLQPASEELGDKALPQPEVTEFPVHNVLKP